jgi:hypothetical protein
MIYQRTSPVGVDKAVDRIQTTIYSYIQNQWSLTEAQIISFGRVHKITGKTDKLRWYDTDYKTYDMLLESNIAALFFFIASGNATFTDIFNREVWMYMFVNLETVKPTITHRADEEVKMDIYNRLKPMEAFGGFGEMDLPNFNSKMDVQPYHAFKIILNLRYQ